MNWKTIRLELAPTANFPKGSVGRGFLIRAPVNDDGKIDELSLLRTPARAKVRRVWPSEPDQGGEFVRVDGHWAMRFPGTADRMIDIDAPLRAGGEVLVTFEGGTAPFKVKLFD